MAIQEVYKMNTGGTVEYHKVGSVSLNLNPTNKSLSVQVDSYINEAVRRVNMQPVNLGMGGPLMGPMPGSPGSVNWPPWQSSFTMTEAQMATLQPAVDAFVAALYAVLEAQPQFSAGTKV